MSGLAPKEVEALRPGRQVPGVWKGARHPGRAVLLWVHPSMVCDLQEDQDDDALSDVWLVLLDRKDSGR